MAGIEKVEYWAKRWEEGYIPWHKPYIHECLEQHYQKLIPSSEQPSKPRIFVPLCGKSLDMVWLEEKGFQVVGLEGVESAIKTFFQENNIPFEVKPSPNTPNIKCYHAISKDITIYSMNVFDIADNKSLGGSFDAIYDRDSLTAIGLYTENRGKRYADILTSLLKPHGRILVEHNIFEEGYGPLPELGHPTHIPAGVLRDMFGSKFEIVTLDVINLPDYGDHCERVYKLMSLK